MPIKPLDIRRKEFKNGFRGYDANQVDDFLDAVADEFERSYTENQRMREEISSLRDRLQQFEELEGSIRAALVHAEQAANDLRRTATREAEDVRQSARREAEFTVREAQSRSHQMLADSSARIERVQESYEALQEAKRSFTNDFRHLLKTYLDMMENMEVSSAQEIEASLRQRLDTESIAVVREAAAQEEARLAEEPSAEPPAPETADPETTDDGQTVSGHAIVEPAEATAAPAADEEIPEDPGATQRIEAENAGQGSSVTASEDAPTEVLRPEEASVEGPLAEEPPAEEPTEAAEPEVEPSTAQGDTAQEPEVSEPEAAEEVEREEPSLAEESKSDEFFDREESSRDRGDSRIFRASRFLRRRE